jgi:hypothetical protein
MAETGRIGIETDRFNDCDGRSTDVGGVVRRF